MNRRLWAFTTTGVMVVASFLVFVPAIPTHPFPQTDIEFTLWESVTFYLSHFGGVYGFCGQYAFAYGSQFGVHCV
jgi:hypothetical protein